MSKKKYLVIVFVLILLFCFVNSINENNFSGNLKNNSNLYKKIFNQKTLINLDINIKNDLINGNDYAFFYTMLPDLLNNNISNKFANNNINIPGRVMSDIEEANITISKIPNEKILKCPESPSIKTYNRETQESGIICPDGSKAYGITSAKDVGQYIQKCIPNNGYKFESDCSVNWIINHSSTYGTIKFYNNIFGDNKVVTKEYDKSVGLDTLFIPNKWGRSGYVLAGWSKNKNSKIPDFDVFSDINPSTFLLEDTTSNSDLYAVWAPLNSTYGNVVLIGDSYVNSSNWPQKMVQKLDLKRSFTLLQLCGTGFINTVRGIGGKTDINFSTLLGYADDIIADNNQVKYVVIMAGYNDYIYDKEELKQTIISFAKETHKRFPNSTLYIGMVGTNFKDETIEEKLLTITDIAYKEAANSLPYVKYVPYNDNISISEYLKEFGNIDDDTYSNGCALSEESDSCYYFVEKTDTVIHTLHPTKATGDIIADIATKFIQKDLAG